MPLILWNISQNACESHPKNHVPLYKDEKTMQRRRTSKESQSKLPQNFFPKNALRHFWRHFVKYTGVRKLNAMFLTRKTVLIPVHQRNIQEIPLTREKNS